MKPANADQSFFLQGAHGTDSVKVNASRQALPDPSNERAQFMRKWYWT
jgi:hypothetical protein